ncbi:MAG: phosphatase PAP2 family protein [archaeon]
MEIGIDLAVNSLMHSIQAPSMYYFFAGFTFLGSPTFWIILVATMYWLGKEKDSFFLMNLVVFTGAIVAIMKPLFGIQRPPTAETAQKIVGADLYSGLSFPSGHTTMIAAIYGYWEKWWNKKQKLAVICLAALVAFSRLYLEVHWLTDVAAGLVAGYVIGKANLWIVNKMEKKSFRLTEFEDEAAIVVLLVFGIMLIFLLESFGIVAVLIGYYVGFFWLKEIRFKQSGVGKREAFPKLLAGYAGAAIPIALIYFVPSAAPWLYLWLGLWISLVYPLAYDAFKSAWFPATSAPKKPKKH